jgi:hypothetical protein
VYLLKIAQGWSPVRASAMANYQRTPKVIYERTVEAFRRYLKTSRSNRKTA